MCRSVHHGWPPAGTGAIVAVVDSNQIARELASQMIAHRNKLAGKADDAHSTFTALDTAARTIERHRADHRSTATTATSHWEGRNAEGFDRRARRMTKALDGTATTTAKAAKVVEATANTLTHRHQAIADLVEEYTSRAVPLIDAARTALDAGQRSAAVRIGGQVHDLVRNYTNESVKHLRAAHHQMKDAAATLRRLERTVEHDGYADPERRKRRPGSERERSGGGKVAGKITKVAESQLGYHEGPGNQNKYGPTGFWCSNFATWVWRKSGVDIGILPFTGDVYEWGQERGLAYGKNSLDQARPGDVLLFGIGPESPQTSTHVGIVESRDGNKVTLIEGNSGDEVRRVTHTLSSATFYGGVHPK